MDKYLSPLPILISISDRSSGNVHPQGQPLPLQGSGNWKNIRLLLENKSVAGIRFC